MFDSLFLKGDLPRESCRVLELKTLDFSNTCRIILKSHFFKEVFQNTSRAVHVGEPREGLFLFF